MKWPRPGIVELHNGRPTLRHYLSNTKLDRWLVEDVIRRLGGWPLVTPFEEIVKLPRLYSEETLRVARDYVAMIEWGLKL